LAAEKSSSEASSEESYELEVYSNLVDTVDLNQPYTEEEPEYSEILGGTESAELDIIDTGSPEIVEVRIYYLTELVMYIRILI